ncbi:uncharacterized protein [Triticum aestivum]|uniref:uncharacterized protein isoform X1 n=1 Tax=Triticum aestivum TaxID=4565 RepID=UPI001ABCD1CB|nr:uncharacterized protein LOC109778553 isoform X2 [Aegilops tauschii subsp. strangulata]XP_044438618.1 uncharacterized protein LOC123165058 isoform X1 [Triticum aestivum]
MRRKRARALDLCAPVLYVSDGGVGCGAADLERGPRGGSGAHDRRLEPLSSPQPSTAGLSPVSSPLRSPWRTAASSLPPSSTAPRPDSSTQGHGEPAGGALSSHLIFLRGEGMRPGHGEKSSCSCRFKRRGGPWREKPAAAMPTSSSSWRRPRRWLRIKLLHLGQRRRRVGDGSAGVLDQKLPGSPSPG